jgi:hypothetical protein
MPTPASAATSTVNATAAPGFWGGSTSGFVIEVASLVAACGA